MTVPTEQPATAAEWLARTVHEHFDRTAIPVDMLRPTEHAMLDALAQFDIEAEVAARDPEAVRLREALSVLEADGRDRHRPVDWRYGVRHSVSVITNALAASPEPAETCKRCGQVLDDGQCPGTAASPEPTEGLERAFIKGWYAAILYAIDEGGDPRESIEARRQAAEYARLQQQPKEQG